MNSAFPNGLRIGDEWICTESEMPGRKGRVFPVRSEEEASLLNRASHGGARFRQVKWGNGRRFKLHGHARA